MPANQSDFLFYICRTDDNSFSLFNRMTDGLILSEVNKEEVENFLNINNPFHPFVTDTDVNERDFNYTAGVHSYDEYAPSFFQDTLSDWEPQSQLPTQLEFGDYLKSVERTVSELSKENYPDLPSDKTSKDS